MNLFDLKKLKIYRDKAAPNFNNFNFLKQELSEILLERLDHATGEFPLALDLMSHTGDTTLLLQNHPKIKSVVSGDISSEMLKLCNNHLKVQLDPLNMPFKPNTFNLVISVFGLHSFNNLPIIFKNIYNILQKGGLILLSIPCYGNLSNLSSAIYNAELLTSNSTTPHIHPFMDIKTMGNLINEAGFTSIITDKEKLTIMYKNLTNIFKDLKGMGENNILLEEPHNLTPIKFLPHFKNAMQLYLDKDNNHYKINIEVCNIMAWKA
ncbi:class I SAM-dependent methyltransferase [Rickettsiales bacterium LUAb2]